VKNSLIAAQEYFFDHSNVRFTANPKLALGSDIGFAAISLY
jgi:hypothetical protein